MQSSFNIRIISFFIFSFSFFSCTVQKKATIAPIDPLTQFANENVLQTSAIKTAHIGIHIFEPATGKTWYDYQGDHYFVPASNTKLPTCYAAMKYLGDSLVAFRTAYSDSVMLIIPAGDPTLLHPDYSSERIISFLRNEKRKLYITREYWKEDALGSGWTWNDYNEYYMTERSALPLYGNVIRWTQELGTDSKPLIYSVPEVNWPVIFSEDNSPHKFGVTRALGSNTYTLTEGTEDKKEQDVPYATNGIASAVELLSDSIHQKISAINDSHILNKHGHLSYGKIRSQPTDSLLKPMMHRSDNFFAEQSLLMVSNELLGYMSDEKIIDTLLKTDFRDLPQKPRWADGSGLSRYKLFSPRDFVAILGKMKDEFGMDRIKNILATGGTGTISSYYKADSGFIFGKTGTLSGVVAFSGFLYTKQNKLLIFSTLVNNHTGSATEVRRSVEKFLEYVRNNY
jgi:D-alanyl-D-alanine carboxypeptidase/D-alanyl-D-alanine-endopeptidase (penicillin-binding protein 4)